MSGPFELIAADLRLCLAMFEALDAAASVEGVHEVAIWFKGEGDRMKVTYGEASEAALVAVDRLPDDGPPF